MKGDFTRDTFDRSRHYSRVLMQQGRVQLDADWNEQAALMLHQLRTLAVDLVGPAWAVGDGFQLTIGDDDFTIGPGRFYVDGICCELDASLGFLAQAGVREADRHWNTDMSYLVYLDAWERLVTAAEDERIREVALGGADTAARAQVVWQVRLLPVPRQDTPTGGRLTCAAARTRLQERLLRTMPVLYAWAVDDAADSPCEIAPDSSYRGPENQLYRVEIHDPGEVGTAGEAPSFKWSRDNGSVVFPVLAVAGGQQSTVTLAHLGRDERSGLTEGDWVELVDDASMYQERHDSLLRVTAVDEERMTVTLSGQLVDSAGPAPRGRVLRRWDQRKGVTERGVVAVKESTAPGQNVFMLEDGVSIRFEPGGQYRTGDYWLIPARTATGDVEWPRATVNGVVLPVGLEPHGVVHHYGLLGVLAADGGEWGLTNCRCAVPVGGLAQCP
jgi:hypothetical protein